MASVVSPLSVFCRPTSRQIISTTFFITKVNSILKSIPIWTTCIAPSIKTTSTAYFQTNSQSKGPNKYPARSCMGMKRKRLSNSLKCFACSKITLSSKRSCGWTTSRCNSSTVQTNRSFKPALSSPPTINFLLLTCWKCHSTSFGRVCTIKPNNRSILMISVYKTNLCKSENYILKLSK